MSQPLFVHPLSASERDELLAAEAQSRLLGERNRVRSVLLSAKGHKVDEIADLLDVCPRTARRAVHGFERAGVAGLREGRRTGRPGRVPP